MSRSAAASVTCILPVYNGERFLREAIESVLDQCQPDLDLLVVDDGSVDGTHAILREFDGRLRVIRQEHAGVAAARNVGLEAARGDFIAFQDADDVWMSGKLDRQLVHFARHPEVDLCLGMVQNFWMDELAAEEAAFQGRRFATAVPGFLLACVLARRSAFETVGRFDTALRTGEDTEWFLRAREARLVEGFVPELLVRRRLHRGNLTRSDLASRDALLASMKASLDRRRGRTDLSRS